MHILYSGEYRLNYEMNVINNTVPVKICCLVWNVLKAVKKVKCKMWFDGEN